MKEISAEKLKKMLEDKEDFILLDVREKHEHEYKKIPTSINIPVRDLPENLDKLDKGKLIVVHCRSGGRSAYAAELLLKKGYNAVNLKGGILAWIAISHN